ncbi:MAG: cob(I)yrinic acid a,c-diamide adenosyltransferase [Opitutaceae bacterium]
MSIATRTGDLGTTALMYGRRVPKSHPRVEAYGTVDELNAALGFVRATADDPWVRELIEATQHELIGLMGELAVADEDRQRYEDSKYERTRPGHLDRLDALVVRLEGENIRFEGWATPGASLHAAALDLARTTCRRSERRIWGLEESGSPVNPLALKYLNRLSDVLWLLARRDESRGKGAS